MYNDSTEPVRLKKLRRELVKTIPRFPNNRDALNHMQQKKLPAILIDYVNWRSRYIGVRPREVVVDPIAICTSGWVNMSIEITAFLDKVRRGEDVTPHLSLAPHGDMQCRGIHLLKMLGLIRIFY